MKNRSTLILGFVFFVGFFVSCASRPVMIPPRPLSPVEMAVILVKHNSHQLNKFFFLDENRNIVVKADVEAFDVIFDMGNVHDFKTGFLVPFVVISLETGESRQDVLFWRPEVSAAGILLSFDDDYTENWESYFDLFDYYGAKVTFFVQGEYCSFCNAALRRGHDVGYHSWNHLNLPTVSRDVFYTETLAQVPAFRNAGIPLDSFAYPFGLSQSWMHEELLRSFRILRGYGVTYRLYDRKTIREGYISSRAIDTILFREDRDFTDAVNIMLRTVKFVDGDLILPLTSHVISDNADWGIKPHRLDYLLNTTNILKLNYYLYRDFIY